ADEHVRALVVSARQRIANGGPIGALGDGGLDSIFLEQPLLVRDDNGRAIRQGNHAESHPGRLRRIAGVNAAEPALWYAAQECGDAKSFAGRGEEFAPAEIMSRR